MKSDVKSEISRRFFAGEDPTGSGQTAASGRFSGAETAWRAAIVVLELPVEIVQVGKAASEGNVVDGAAGGVDLNGGILQPDQSQVLLGTVPGQGSELMGKMGVGNIEFLTDIVDMDSLPVVNIHIGLNIQNAGFPGIGFLA